MDLAKRLESELPALYFRRVREAAAMAERMGLTPYLVGGVVRDLILGWRFRNDCDITFTGGSIAELAKLLAARWKLEHIHYAQFETHTLLSANGFHFDLITARKETYAKPAALPRVDRGDLKSDLKRRDFTVNAMAVELTGKNWGKLIDPLGGLADIKSKKIRALHAKSFIDDPTRIFRAARYAGRFGFSLDRKTETLIRQAVQKKTIPLLSADRVRTEIEKILCEKLPAPAIAHLYEWKAFKFIHPALRWNRDIERWINEETRLEKIGKPSVVAARMALWLCENSTFEAESVIEHLNFTNDVRDKISEPLQLIQAFRQSRPADSMPLGLLRQETVRVFEILTKHNVHPEISKSWKVFQKWLASKPQINGTDLQNMGFKPGPLYKEILNKLRAKKFRGGLDSKEDEIRFVFDNFRRN